jgi:hypothetical protein
MEDNTLKKLFILMALIVFFAIDAFGQSIPYRIRMASSSYTAQLRGKTATRTAGLTIQGSYSTTFNAHEFVVTKDGYYDLWFDAAGGTNYVKDAAWSGSAGKYVSSGYFDDAIDTDLDYKVDQIDDGAVALSNLSAAALAYIGSGGNVTNNADDSTIAVNGSDSTLYVKESYLDTYRDTYHYYINSSMSGAQMQAVLDSAAGKDVKIVFERGSYSFSQSFNLLAAKNVTIEGNNSTINMNNNQFLITTAATTTEIIYGGYDTYGYTAFTSKITGDIAKGENEIKLASASALNGMNLSYGDMIALADSAETGGGYRRGYYFFYDSLRSDTLVLQNESPFNIDFGSQSGRSFFHNNQGGNSAQVSGINMIDGRIHVTGFENAQISDISYKGTDQNYYVGQPTSALQVDMCRSIQINNVYVRNMLATGNGYGIGVMGYESCLVNNVYLANTRHPFTTNNTTWHYDGQLTVSNYYAIQYASGERTAGGMSTHGNILNANFYNGYLNGFSPAFGGRGHHHVIDGLIIDNCNAGFDVFNGTGAGDSVGVYQGHKSYVIRNVQMKNSNGAFIYNGASNQTNHHIARIEIDNCRYEPESGGVNGVFGMASDSTLTIDSMIVRNFDAGVYGGLAGAVAGQVWDNSGSADPVRKPYKYVLFEDCNFDDMYYFFVGRFTVEKLILKGNRFTKIGSFNSNAGDVNSKAHVEFIGNTFDMQGQVHASNLFWSHSDTVNFSYVKFKDNTFIGQTNPLWFYRCQVDTLIADGNEFYRPSWGGYDNLPTYQSLGHVVKSWTTNNIWRNQAGGSVTLANVAGGEHYFTNNYFHATDASRLISAYGNCYIRDNIWVVDSLHALTDSRVILTATSNSTYRNVFIENNLFDIRTDDGDWFRFLTAASGDTAIFNQNTIYLRETPHTSTSMFYGPGHVIAGTNYTYGFITEDGGGSLSRGYMPIMLNFTIIDSVKTEVDSLKFYFNGNNYNAIK